MKKVLSVMLSIIMTVCMLSVTAIPAMAADVNSPTAAVVTRPTTQVNGGTVGENDIHYEQVNDNPYTATFTYVGEGTLVGWEDNMADLGFTEGVDYTVVYNEDGSYTIMFISDEAQAAYTGNSVIVNAVVEFADGSTTAVKNDSSKSPSTGLATTAIAGSAAAAMAGFAVLSAKKRDAE